MYQPDDFDTELFAETVLIGTLYGLIAFALGFFMHLLTSDGNPFESLEGSMATVLRGKALSMFTEFLYVTKKAPSIRSG